MTMPHMTTSRACFISPPSHSLTLRVPLPPLLPSPSPRLPSIISLSLPTPFPTSHSFPIFTMDRFMYFSHSFFFVLSFSLLVCSHLSCPVVRLMKQTDAEHWTLDTKQMTNLRKCAVLMDCIIIMKYIIYYGVCYSFI